MTQSYDAILKRVVTSTPRVPGVVAMVTDRERNIYEGAAGLRRIDGPTAMTTDSVFAIFSTTKAITATAALQLVEALQPDFLLTDIRMPFISGMFSAPAKRSTATMKTAIPICACSAKPSTGSSFSREKPSPTTTRWASARRKRATSPPPPTPATA